MAAGIEDLKLVLAVYESKAASVSELESSLGVSRATILRRINRVRVVYGVDIRSLWVGGCRGYGIVSWGVFDQNNFVNHVGELTKEPK